MIFKMSLLSFGLLLTLDITAQSILSQAEAFEIMLANNYGIKVAKNNLLIAENNTSKELNGYVPQVNVTGGTNGSLGGSQQKFSS